MVSSVTARCSHSEAAKQPQTITLPPPLCITVGMILQYVPDLLLKVCLFSCQRKKLHYICSLFVTFWSKCLWSLLYICVILKTCGHRSSTNVTVGTTHIPQHGPLQLRDVERPVLRKSGVKRISKHCLVLLCYWTVCLQLYFLTFSPF